MKLIPCPLNGLRNATEFACLGEVRQPPSGDADNTWASYVWNRRNEAGVVREWWCHLPSTTWFIAERDTTTDRFLKTYLPSQTAEAPT
jgi:sarcosine oxidase, subunit delta